MNASGFVETIAVVSLQVIPGNLGRLHPVAESQRF